MSTRNYYTLIFLLLLCLGTARAETFMVSSQAEFDAALNNAAANDTIMWKTGIYRDIFMDIRRDNVVILAEVSGDTKFTDASRVYITGDFVTLKGFQFIDGDIGTEDVIETTGSNNLFTELNISGYTSYKYLVHGSGQVRPG